MYQIDDQIFQHEGEARWFKFLTSAGIDVTVSQQQDFYQFILEMSHGNVYARVINSDTADDGGEYRWCLDNQTTLFILRPVVDAEFLMFSGDPNLIEQLGLTDYVDDANAITLFGVFEKCNCDDPEDHIGVRYATLDILKIDWDIFVSDAYSEKWLSDKFNEADECEIKEMAF